MNFKYAPYSFSKLSTHYGCNRKFKYNYIDKIPQGDFDKTALLKGGALHNILEHYPSPPTNKLAPKHMHIIDKFLQTDLGKFYIFRESMREFDFGMTEDFKPTGYYSKDALFRGSVDYIFIDNLTVDEVIEVDSLDDIPDEFELIEVLE